MRRNDLPIVLAASLVFADATIVTLALPNLLVDLHTTVYGVAAVLAVYTGALGCTALLAHRLLRLAPFEWMGIAALVLFSLASIVCALADRLSVLLVARALQGIAGALVLAVAGASLAPRAARAWVFVGVLSAAVGPVVGGALTQAFSWRSIFVAQVPIPLLAAMLRKTWSDALPPTDSMRRPVLRPILVLGLVSGALSALLFGVVLLLVVGWAMRPLSAALAVTLVPISALAGVLVRGHAETRVAAGCGLIGGGIGALAFLPSNAVGWLVLPECVAGFGMGLALAALIEHVLPERAHAGRAVNLAVRHLGITLALVALAPVIAHDLDAATERAKLRTVAVVLDAPISPGEKLRLAPMLVASVRSDHRPATLSTGHFSSPRHSRFSPRYSWSWMHAGWPLRRSRPAARSSGRRRSPTTTRRRAPSRSRIRAGRGSFPTPAASGAPCRWSRSGRSMLPRADWVPRAKSSFSPLPTSRRRSASGAGTASAHEASARSCGCSACVEDRDRISGSGRLGRRRSLL